jgi:hypothetical protein
MLTPPNCCIQVALSINRTTYCFDKSYRRDSARRDWGSVVYFWRTASTNEGSSLACCSEIRQCGKESPMSAEGSIFRSSSRG